MGCCNSKSTTKRDRNRSSAGFSDNEENNKTENSITANQRSRKNKNKKRLGRRGEKNFSKVLLQRCDSEYSSSAAPSTTESISSNNMMKTYNGGEGVHSGTLAIPPPLPSLHKSQSDLHVSGSGDFCSPAELAAAGTAAKRKNKKKGGKKVVRGRQKDTGANHQQKEKQKQQRGLGSSVTSPRSRSSSSSSSSSPMHQTTTTTTATETTEGTYTDDDEDDDEDVELRRGESFPRQDSDLSLEDHHHHQQQHLQRIPSAHGTQRTTTTGTSSSTFPSTTNVPHPRLASFEMASSLHHANEEQTHHPHAPQIASEDEKEQRGKRRQEDSVKVRGESEGKKMEAEGDEEDLELTVSRLVTGDIEDSSPLRSAPMSTPRTSSFKVLSNRTTTNNNNNIGSRRGSRTGGSMQTAAAAAAAAQQQQRDVQQFPPLVQDMMVDEENGGAGAGAEGSLEYPPTCTSGSVRSESLGPSGKERHRHCHGDFRSLEDNSLPSATTHSLSAEEEKDSLSSFSSPRQFMIGKGEKVTLKRDDDPESLCQPTSAATHRLLRLDPENRTPTVTVATGTVPTEQQLTRQDPHCDDEDDDEEEENPLALHRSVELPEAPIPGIRASPLQRSLSGISRASSGSNKADRSPATLSTDELALALLDLNGEGAFTTPRARSVAHALPRNANSRLTSSEDRPVHHSSLSSGLWSSSLEARRGKSPRS